MHVMNYIQLFTFENQKVRMVTVDGEPYFASKDVAIIWIYGNPTKAPRTHVTRKPILDTLGGKQRTTILNKSGLYSLILSSKLPICVSMRLTYLTRKSKNCWLVLTQSLNWQLSLKRCEGRLLLNCRLIKLKPKIMTTTKY